MLFYIFSLHHVSDFLQKHKPRAFPPNNDNFMEKLSWLKKATFFPPSEACVGCFLPHAATRNTESQINPRKQKRGVKYEQRREEKRGIRETETAQPLEEKGIINCFPYKRENQAYKGPFLLPFPIQRTKPRAFMAFLCPLVGRGGQCFSLSDSHSLMHLSAFLLHHEFW